jgi:hypothetical protein
MKRQPVTSRNIKSIGYDGVSETLEIEFNSGGIYEYAGIPEAVYTALTKAESHGSYFHRHIREKYRYRKTG